MATLFPPGLRLFDADGAPLSGAKVRVYTANTTTLASLYSDAALSSAISNPVVTDVAGYPANGGNECAIYCAAGTYDVAFLDANDVLLASWDDVSPAGESGDLERTLTGNGRIKITGSAGAVLIQVGDPSPDNTGGTLTIEGQAGSQGDTVTLDFATVNAGTTGGALKENGKKLDGVVYTEATTVTAATSVDIALPNDPTGATAYEIEIWGYSQSGNGNLSLQTSHDGGSNYKAGASDYTYGYHHGITTTGLASTAKVTTTSAQLASNLNGSANLLGGLTLNIVTPNSGSNATFIRWRADGIINTGELSSVIGMAHTATGYGRATHVRLLLSASTFTFKYRVRARRGFGE